ncbi:carboxylesterase/lipase family protein [Microlunatus sp. GCM10028923]|uniref:carboxylesterase/lipase family protein n=1 Tax=Microlunatus sp. GCM10028923 TaxID=3273400 RepID=UPI003619D5A8
MKPVIRAVLVIAATLLTLAGLIAPSAAAPAGPKAVARTENGLVRGTSEAGVAVYQGIPYAAPPVGERRWRTPEPAADWAGLRDASRPGAACAQAGDFIGDPPSDAEDCLYLNVTTPRHASARRPVPVMVWLHGGGFQWGSGSIYGAEKLARRGDVMVVTLNYRLNVSGFLAHPALAGSGQDAGNLGVEDQQAALRWVRRNAAAFGGDPGNVTIFGESAGAQVSCTHLTAPGSRGLFERVIMQSGPCTLNWPYGDTWRAKPRAEAEEIALAVAEKAGCADPATAGTCLRSKSVAELLAADAGEHGHGPSFGGNPVIPEDPARLLAAGRAADVPVLHGTTRDEHVTFQVGMELMTGGPVPPQAYGPVLGQFLGLDAGQTDRVLREYPLSDYDGSTGAALSTVLTDWAWACPAAQTNDLLARRGPTYAFEFADRTAPWLGGTEAPDFPTGAFHAGELQYLFSGAYAGQPLTAQQRRLSDRMIDYWTAFARTGDPSRPGLPAWSRLRPGDTRVQALAPGAGGIRPVDLHREHRCGFWNSL